MKSDHVSDSNTSIHLKDLSYNNVKDFTFTIATTGSDPWPQHRLFVQLFSVWCLVFHKKRPNKVINVPLSHISADINLSKTL